MRVLALTTYPAEAAATRFRVQQLIEPLHELGVSVEVRPLLDSETFHGLYDRRNARRTAWRLSGAHVRRLRQVLEARQADVVLLQREAALLGPPLVEILIDTLVKRPMVLDLDDPTWVSYASPTFGRLGPLLKWQGKADWLIDRAAVVTCGSRAIARYAEARGAVTCLVPTVVDTGLFTPRPPASAERGGPPVVGWIGSHSTAPYLAAIAPALAEVAARTAFRLLVVGGGANRMRVPGVPVEERAWSLDREVSDFQSLDVGLYPLQDDDWSRGKSGFKAIQYLACGIPFVVSPIGATCDIGDPGTTHLDARSLTEWTEAVHRLVADAPARTAMGAAGRAYSLEHYTVPQVADLLADALRAAA